MYVPRHNEETGIGVMHELLRANPLGMWVTLGDDGLIANPIPFLIDPERGEFGTLVGHVARANPVWKSFSKTVDSLVIFQGPQAYVSPSWYPAKQEHGKVVPTWNYAVVHAYGKPRVIEDRDWLLNHVEQQTDTREAGLAMPWAVTDAPPDYIDSMLKAIVGIEIPVTKLVGKWKVSQNRPKADRQGVVEGLLARGNEASVEMAELVKSRLIQP
jgi:transcriptional regulator